MLLRILRRQITEKDKDPAKNPTLSTSDDGTSEVTQDRRLAYSRKNA